MSSLPAGSLALALSGFTVYEASEGTEAPGAPLAVTAAARPRPVAAGAAALVDHASTIARRVLDRWRASDYDAEPDSEQLASLVFALQSAMGRGRLGEADERRLFELASALWDASLQALAAASCDGAGAAADGSAAPALERMGNDLFMLLDVEGSDPSQDCAAYVSFFSRAAASWQAAGQGERARWCLDRAMKHSAALEAQVASEVVPAERKEGCVVALFNLYLEGAKVAASSGKQRALANNLLSRAVQLSRHAAVGPAAQVACCIAVAELQLDQARQMLAKGGATAGLAAALLSSSYQQLSGADLQVAAASSGAAMHRAGLADARQQVLMLLCKAHLVAGDAAAACKALEALEAEAPGAAAQRPELQLLCVEAKVAAGRLPEALGFLLELLKAADLAVPAGTAAAEAFLTGLRLALRHISEDSLHSFQSAVSAFVWKVTAASTAPTALLSLVQALLAQEQGSTLCQRLALQALTSDDTSAALHRDTEVLAQLHAVLWHKAAQCFEASNYTAAKELFAAAFQYSNTTARPKGARALAACYSRLGQHQRAAEYLEVAARQEQQLLHQPSSLTQLLRLRELALTGDAEQAVAAICSLGTACSDFHASLIPAINEAAAKACNPAVSKSALGAAVDLLIKPVMEAGASRMAAGQEAALLLAYLRAIAACLEAALAMPEDALSAGTGALCAELVAALKLAARRLKMLGWQAFVGGDAKGTSMLSLCALAYNQLLALQHKGALEHAVALATPLFQLLPLADQHVRADVTGAAQQARVLLLTTQALLALHNKQPDSPQRLSLAIKLQPKVASHMALLPVEQYRQLHILHSCLCLEVASRQGDGAAVLQCISRLQPHAAQLLTPQRAAILAMMGGQHSKVLHEAAAALLLDSIAADGSVEAASLVPALLSQLALSEDSMMQTVRRCHKLLAAVPLPSRTDGWSQCGQWLAVHAWNAGAKLAESTAGDCSALAGELMEVAVQLLEACVPAGSRLPRMKAALAAMNTGGSCRSNARAGAAGTDAPAGFVLPTGSTLGAAEEAGAASAGALPGAGSRNPITAMAASAADPSEPDGAAEAAAGGCSGMQPTPGYAAPQPVSVPSSQAASQQPAAIGSWPPAGFAMQLHTTTPIMPAAPAHLPAAPAAAADADAGKPRGLAAAAAAVVAGAAGSSASQDSMSDASDDEDGSGGGSWLHAVMAAQKRVFSISARAGGGPPAKAQAVQAMGLLGRRQVAGTARPAAAAGGEAPQALQQLVDQDCATAADGVEALSLGNSEPAPPRGFMGL